MGFERNLPRFGAASLEASLIYLKLIVIYFLVYSFTKSIFKIKVIVYDKQKDKQVWFFVKIFRKMKRLT